MPRLWMVVHWVLFFSGWFSFLVARIMQNIEDRKEIMQIAMVFLLLDISVLLVMSI